ncbi:hypothetical protein [Microcoleus sp. N9_A1]|uniref:hypothetical protein n=1 Tax=Microcoleus sp. N9_A1 TaxID=3055380 RepID=UPI002FD03AF3
MEDLDIDSEETKEPDLKESARELANFENLQLPSSGYLSGYEIHALIVAAQMLQISPQAENLGPVTKAALLGGMKLQRLFLTSPHSFALLNQGWDLMEPEKITA